MKVLVFGNVCSGKTTVCRLLQTYTSYKYVGIDQMRVDHSDGSHEGEMIACETFYEQVRLPETQIIECLGIGKVTEKTHDILIDSTEPVVCLILNTPKDVCLDRLKDRVWNVPFVLPKETIYGLVDKVDQHINSGQIRARWAIRPNTLVLSQENSQPEDLTRIVNEVISIINSFELHG